MVAGTLLLTAENARARWVIAEIPRLRLEEVLGMFPEAPFELGPRGLIVAAAPLVVAPGGSHAGSGGRGRLVGCRHDGLTRVNRCRDDRLSRLARPHSSMSTLIINALHLPAVREVVHVLDGLQAFLAEGSPAIEAFRGADGLEAQHPRDRLENLYDPGLVAWSYSRSG